ncbi:peptidase S10 [Pseudonocardiaceae bacterium YIM PH 21723]|nr:peptidase S10 [Pseudonocardiaceae bacterium YIM PH 21723]
MTDTEAAQDTVEPGEPQDDLVSTSHTLTLDRRKLAYTATTGRIVLRSEAVKDDAFDGHQAKAEVFITAYTLDKADPKTRPVTFAFNGGPGSSSVWLHLGVLGPRRVDSGDAGALTPPPYDLVDNPDTLLAHSDLVFIDPVSTGFSRPVKGVNARDYHGFTPDLESVGEIIRLWTSRNGRWLSPKYLAGESYGTTRAAGLAEFLFSRYGMTLNGLMLISAVLDFSTIDFSTDNDLPYRYFLPTYAAIAHFHGKHGDRPLREVLDEAEQFASREYPYLLSEGARLSTEDRAAAVTKLAGLIGVSEEWVDRVDLRPEHVRYFTELLRSERKTVGRLDGRFTGWDADYGRERWSDDPSMSAITGPYTAALNHYLRMELEYQNDLPYEILNMKVWPWSYKEFEARSVTVTDRLAAAMRTNPHLKVHVASGYYDGATPYHATDLTLARLPIPAELRSNIEVKYYPAGHMMYLHDESRRQQAADLAAFVTASTNR